MPIDYEYEQTVARDDATAIIQALGAGVSAGTIRFETDEAPIDLDVPDTIDVDLELETEDEAIEVELELGWSGDPEEVVETEVDIEETSVDAADEAPVDDVSTAEAASTPAHPTSQSRFELFQDRADEWRWRLVHHNGNVIATGGEGYTAKHNALNGLRSVKENVPGAEIVEDTGASES